MNTFKHGLANRLLAIVLALVMVLGMLPITELRAEAVGETTAVEGDNTGDTGTTDPSDPSDPSDPEETDSEITDVEIVFAEDLTYSGEEQELAWVTGNTDAYTITYTVNGEETNKATNAGEYNVTVSVSAEGYVALTKERVVKIAPKEIKGIDIIQKEFDYTGEDEELVTLKGKLTGYDVTWYVNGAEVDGTDVPTAKAVGTYVVKLVVCSKDGNSYFEKEVTSTISAADIDIGKLRIEEEKNAVYTVENGVVKVWNLVTVKNQGNYTLEFKVNNGEWSTELPTASLADTYVVSARVSKEGHEEKIIGEWEVTIAKAKQELEFANELPESLVLSENTDDNVYDFSAEGENLSGKEIVYSLENATSDGVATIDANGQLTVKAAGAVTVVATREGNENYESVRIEKNIVVTASGNGLVMFVDESGNEIIKDLNVVRGASVVISTIAAIKTNSEDKGTLSYSIDKTDIGLEIDVATGVIIVSEEKALADAVKVDGYVQVKVTVEKTADIRKYWGKPTELFPLSFDTYTLNIYYARVPDFDNICKIKDPNDNGWYNNSTYQAVISVIKETVTNEDGTTSEVANYLISLDPDGGYSESVTVLEDGTVDRTIYVWDVQNERPCVPITRPGIQVDTLAPVDLEIEYSEPKTLWEEVLYFFNPEVTVTFKAKDDTSAVALDQTSGIASFAWTYTKSSDALNALESKPGTVTPKWVEAEGAYVATITLTATAAEQYRGHLSFTATDNAGNATTINDDNRTIIVDNISPKVSVAYEGAENYTPNSANDQLYFNSEVKVTLNVTEANFFTDDITVTVTKDGKPCEVEVDWNDSDSDVNHTGTFVIEAKDGVYEIQLGGEDKAGNNIVVEEYCRKVTIDTTAPEIVIKTSADELEDVTTDQEQTITVEITERNFSAQYIQAETTGVNIKNESVTVKAEKILAYMQDDKNWEHHEGGLHTLVLKSTGDGTDNLLAEAIYTMVVNCSDLAQNPAEEAELKDFVVDHTAPSIVEITFSDSIGEPTILDTILSTITLGFYNPDVTVTFTAYDDISGVKSFNWDYLRHEGASESNLETDKDTLEAKQDYQDPSKFTASIKLPRNEADQLRGNISANAVDKRSNGNERATNDYIVVVDTVAPDVTAAYNEPANVADGVSYYNTDINVTITVKESNFFEEDVVVKITRNGNEIAVTPTWSAAGQDVYNGTLSLAEDGDYQVTITYTDRSKNTSNTYTSDLLTIDKTAPVITVAYDNNDAENAKYFDAIRTATITIVEHNFDVNRVQIESTAARGGVVPTVAWAHNGDIHIATLAYTTDGDYTFGIGMTDLATNANNTVGYGYSVAGTDFVIDTTFEDMITIEGVESGKAYGAKDAITPSVDITDINLDGWDISLVYNQMGKTTDLTDQAKTLMKDRNTTVAGILDLFQAVQEKDGIYTLSITGRDMAGNVDTEEVVFTLNRYGSVYAFDEELEELVADGGSYVQTVPEDLVITEYNADKLIAGSVVIEITRDGKPVDEVIYTVTPDVNDKVEPGETGWYQYSYNISKENFQNDGVYKIYISSKDATGNTPENGNYDDKVMTFRVDTTAPEITSVVGLEEPIINAQEAVVKYSVYDTIGLKSIKIYVDGTLVGSEIVDFGADPNNYEGSFTLYSKNRAQHVQIVVEDMAANVTNTDDEHFESAYEFNKNVTVSTNFFVRWFANTGLFWGSIGGGLALIAALIFVIVGKKKKEEENTKA